MHSLSSWIIGLVASPAGLFVLAALDSTVLFSAPGALDGAVLMLAARQHSRAWVVVLLATAGAQAGAALTFWMGTKIGDHGLERYIAPRRLQRIRRKLKSAGAIGLAVLDLIPPPFPFTPFILAAGALEVDRATFFGTLTACRLLRFGVEALLAVIYGRQIVAWLESDVFHDLVLACTVLAIGLTILSVFKVVRASRPVGRAAVAR